jgi:hypothetical protein
VSYLEGCTAPQRDENQLHAAVVELVALDDAEIKYSTVQNWYPGDEDGKGGIYNFVTKRGDVPRARSQSPGRRSRPARPSPGSTRAASCAATTRVGEFYSIAVTNNRQQADTGTKMIHWAQHRRSRIVSKGISAGHAQNTYRGLVSMHPKAEGARNHTQCDSLLIGDKCGAHTFPYIEAKNDRAQVEHEATTSKIGEDQLFYCMQRGIGRGGRGVDDRQRLLPRRVQGSCRWSSRSRRRSCGQRRAQAPRPARIDAMDFLARVKAEMKAVGMKEEFLYRSVNEGFSGGEKKRNEILQMALLEPRLAGARRDRLGPGHRRAEDRRRGRQSPALPERSMIVITHYQRLLDYIVPDKVHVLSQGRIVRSGGRELALELEEHGYGWIDD